MVFVQRRYIRKYMGIRSHRCSLAGIMNGKEESNIRARLDVKHLINLGLGLLLGCINLIPALVPLLILLGRWYPRRPRLPLFLVRRLLFSHVSAYPALRFARHTPSLSRLSRKRQRIIRSLSCKQYHVPSISILRHPSPRLTRPGRFRPRRRRCCCQAQKRRACGPCPQTHSWRPLSAAAPTPRGGCWAQSRRVLACRRCCPWLNYTGVWCFKYAGMKKE